MDNTLVLVHGFMDTDRRMKFMARQLRDLGWKVLTPSLRSSNGSESIEVLAEQLNLFIEENTIGSERIDLIGFSMGGLICRYYLQHLDCLYKTDNLITLSTPHQGTISAYFFPGAGINQMRPNSSFLENLNLDTTQLQPINFVSFYTPLDLVITPARSSVIKCARNYKVFSLFHPLMVSNKSLLRKMVIILGNKRREMLV
ncbi:triacylglycerol lipase [Dyadobacter sp. 3J3]|uniref:esterase/lipase family protein n=1 Tax=Dyadobacter sp. 3J3 TaxID=2606600 RepID=UPI0013576647|nr:alpha/beta fold hydrolase [Dyadobacter sp. 3J3]